MLSITPSKLSDYVTCPEKFKLRHIDKFSVFNGSAALSFGQTMHSALQLLHQSGDLNCSIDVPRLLERFWDHSAYATAEENENYFYRGCNALRQYIATIAGSDMQTLGTEVFMTRIVKAPAQSIRLGCRADRISLLADGTLEVVDYKTGGGGRIATPEFLLADLSTFIYYLLAQEYYPQYENVQITYLNIMSMAKTSIRYTPEQITENKKALWRCIKAISAGEYNPRPSEACAWCDVQDNCKVASRVLDFATV
jgi:CRISPR/Cas system-associated exonuclease Cas4 (RecB family)